MIVNLPEFFIEHPLNASQGNLTQRIRPWSHYSFIINAEGLEAFTIHKEFRIFLRKYF